MIKRLLHAIVSRPAVYDAVQRFVGGALDKPVQDRIDQIHAESTVLDLGGGNGALGDRLPPSCRYICLDPDIDKLRGFQARSPDGFALLANATKIPLREETVDAVVCKNVSHHLLE